MPSSETTLPARATSVGAARRFLVRLLDEWDLQGLEYDSSVVLSELVTNAVLHARTEVRLRVSHGRSGLRIEVRDGSPKVPLAKRPNPSAATGKGLVLIEALATDWGVQLETGGKTVWARFAEEATVGRTTSTIRSLRPAGNGLLPRGGAGTGGIPTQARAAL